MRGLRSKAWGVFCAVLLLATLLQASSTAANAQSNPRGEGFFPNLPVVTQTGETVRFYDDLLKGKIVVVSFIYTKCTEICPLNTARKAQVADLLQDVLGQSVHFVSISVDPENDTPQRLAAYASAFYSGPGWTFVTGTLANIRAINARLGERMRSLQDHRNEILIGNEITGNWARNSVFGDLDRLAYDIRSMDPAWRSQARGPTQGMSTTASTTVVDSLPGEALFMKLCSGCHAVGGGQRVGPDLHHIAQRRSQEWLVNYIMSPARVRTEKDRDALELVARYPAVRMPELGLSRGDASDLLNFLQARSSMQAAERN